MSSFSINNRHFCKDCRCNFVLESPHYCPNCGNNKITKTHIKYGDEFEMKYAGIQVDQQGKALICPRCNNEELNTSGQFCKICGTNVINECAIVYNNRGFIEEDSCGNRLDGNAEYCSHCGNPSTFS